MRYNFVRYSAISCTSAHYMLNYVDIFSQMLRTARGKICSVVLEKGKHRGRRPRCPGDNCPSAGAYGMRPYGVMGVYLIIYT